jgi:ferredoxin
MRVAVDQSRCKGHGNCAVMAPRIFELGDDDRSHVRTPAGADVPEADEASVEGAIANCPEAAISWAAPRPGAPWPAPGPAR